MTNSFDGKGNISFSDERENLKLEENMKIIVCKKSGSTLVRSMYQKTKFERGLLKLGED